MSRPCGRLVRLVAVLALLTTGLLAVGSESWVAQATEVRSNDTPIYADLTIATSTIGVTGVSGAITKMTVTIDGVNASRPSDMDLMLLGPGGQRIALMSDACGDKFVSGIALIFDSSKPAVPYTGPCASGEYSPTNYSDGTADAWPNPPTAFSLDAFNGTNANGTWTLWVSDDTDTAPTRISRWSLQFDTTPAAISIPASGTQGPASTYPYEIPVVGKTGIVSDVNVRLLGLSHADFEDLDVVLQSPSGETVMLMSDVCHDGVKNDVDLTFDDEALAYVPDACASGAYRPTNSGVSADTMPSPAPPEPHDGQLQAFDGSVPNGTWRLYINDDGADDSGFLQDPPQLDITTRPAAPMCQGEAVTVNLGKGQAPTSRADVILGTAGNDVVNGLGGDDVICGLSGNDTIQGGPGADRIDGGTGIDWASYSGTTAAVTVDLTKTAAQATGGAGSDTLRAFEGLIGGTGDDVLRGNALANDLQGRSGDDSLFGAAGDDTLDGGPGADRCDGSTGTDTATGCETRVSIP